MRAVSGQDISCRRWIVRGRVQGVGFRGYVRRAASYIGVRGTVKNLTDGGVEVVALGNERELKELHAALERGPALARVTSVTGGPGSLALEHEGFRVEYGS